MGAVSFLFIVVDTFGILFYSSFSISESDKEEKPQSTVIPKEVTPALCSLMNNYGSLSGSESEPEGKSWPQLLQWVCFILLLLPLIYTMHQ